jgi:RHS repeat-associated protein
VQSSGSPTALYEYSPFGELIRSTGSASRLNPFQFSTKYLDQETGLSYYGHRYYSASLGRWINRDPIEEEDGPNVYAFVMNKPLNAFDARGMQSSSEQGTAGVTSGTMASQGASGVARTSNFLRGKLDLLQDLYDIQDAIFAMDDPVAAYQQVQELAHEMLSAKKSGTLGKGVQHHITPQMLKNLQPHLKGEVDNFTVALSKRLHRRLHMGKGFGKGGIWNGLWNKFVSNKGGKSDEADMKSFASQMQKLFGLDELDVKRYVR